MTYEFRLPRPGVHAYDLEDPPPHPRRERCAPSQTYDIKLPKLPPFKSGDRVSFVWSPGIDGKAIVHGVKVERAAKVTSGEHAANEEDLHG
jgi:hypothetical protein